MKKILPLSLLLFTLSAGFSSCTSTAKLIRHENDRYFDGLTAHEPYIDCKNEMPLQENKVDCYLNSR